MDEQVETGEFEIRHGVWRARLSGIDTKIVLLAILIVLCLGVFGWVVIENRKLDDEARQSYLGQHKATQNLLMNVIENQTSILKMISATQQGTKDSTNEISYVLSLDQKQREALRLQMPFSLREKIRDRP